MKFPVKVMLELRKPGVYLYRRGDEGIVLYVGATFYGIDRAFDRNHRVLQKEQFDLSLEWIPCPDTWTATLLEEYLIGEFNPLYNVVRTKYLDGIFADKGWDVFQQKLSELKAIALRLGLKDQNTRAVETPSKLDGGSVPGTDS